VRQDKPGPKGREDENLKLGERTQRVRVPSDQSLASRSGASLAWTWVTACAKRRQRENGSSREAPKSTDVVRAEPVGAGEGSNRASARGEQARAHRGRSRGHELERGWPGTWEVPLVPSGKPGRTSRRTRSRPPVEASPTGWRDEERMQDGKRRTRTTEVRVRAMGEVRRLSSTGEAGEQASARTPWREGSREATP